MQSKTLLYAALISFAIMIAILSIPEIMENVADSILNSLGLNLVLVALILIGIIHGLKPDEHTWPITIPYALCQKNLFRGILSSLVFTGALTLVWTLLSAFISQVLSLVSDPEALSPYADLAAGFTMVGVASVFLFKNDGRSLNVSEEQAPDYKYIWIHGLAAAFGGDFFVVLILASVLIGSILPSSLGFMIGLLFGIGSMLSQAIVVTAAYKGAKSIMKRADLMAQSGVLSLLFLGIFLVALGLISITR